MAHEHGVRAIVFSDWLNILLSYGKPGKMSVTSSAGVVYALHVWDTAAWLDVRLGGTGGGGGGAGAGAGAGAGSAAGSDSGSSDGSSYDGQDDMLHTQRSGYTESSIGMASGTSGDGTRGGMYQPLPRPRLLVGHMCVLLLCCLLLVERHVRQSTHTLCALFLLLLQVPYCWCCHPG